jgi:hypothetical protein
MRTGVVESGATQGRKLDPSTGGPTMSERGPEEEPDLNNDPEDSHTGPSESEVPSTQPTSSGRFRPVTLIVTLLVLIVIVAAGVVFFLFFTDRVSHASEETAEFLPAETYLYFSLNMRPGVGQLLRFRGILSRFEENDNFEVQVEETLDDIEEQLGFDLRDDLFPWMGPELAVGVVDFGDFDEEMEIVAFLGTTDREAAEAFLPKFLDYLERQQDIDFQAEASGGFTTYSYTDPENPPGYHFAVTESYIVYATSESLLDSTIARMDNPAATLADTPDFKRARDSVEDQRFAMLYLDLQAIFDDARRNIEEDELESLNTMEGSLPDTLAVSGSFMELGIKVTASYDTPSESFGIEQVNALKSADYLPADTLALISGIGVRNAWEEAKGEIENIPGFYGETVEDLIQGIEDEIGVNIDRDIFGWMSGEVAFALLPSEFRFGDFLELHDAIIKFAAMVEFDDRQAVQSALDNIIDALEETGLDFEPATIRGEDALLADLGEDFGTVDYEPGYVIIDSHVVMGSMRETFEQAIDARDGSIDTLSEGREFKRIADELEDPPDFLFYANVAGIVDMIVEAMTPEMRSSYEEDAEPIVEPIEAFLAGASIDEERTTWTAVLTFE